MTDLAEPSDVSGELAVSAAVEWSNLVTAAVLGTDRRPLPPPEPGWASLNHSADPAVEILDRAAAVATARRAGVQPDPAPLPIAPAPVDARPVCSVAATNLLARMLRGEHDILLPEWFERCASGGFRLPSHLVPALLLRGRRFPALDAAVRRLAGGLPEWLAEAMPELGLATSPGARPPSAPAGAHEFVRPVAPPDSGAVVTVIVECFLDRTATWAAAAQLRLAVAALDESWLPALVLELNRAPFFPVTERTRVDLLGLATTRVEMIAALPLATQTHPVG